MNRREIKRLKLGDEIAYTGKLYTARDQAHKRLIEAIQKKEKLPLDLKDKIIYYCGPTQTPKGRVIGSCGPTTSRRMDVFSPLLLEAGVMAMIGKGNRSPEVCRAIKKNRAVYFVTLAGCGALLSKRVLAKKLIGYADLGPEAIYELEVRDFPLIVAVDAQGRSVYA